MKILPSHGLKEIAEAEAAKMVASMGHYWRSAGREPAALDGFIEIVRGSVLTGQLVGVQVKAGRSYLSNTRKRRDTSPKVRIKHRRIRIERKHIDYYRNCTFPVVVVWYDEVSNNSFWE